MTATDPTALTPKQSQLPIYLIGFGHGATHWVAQTFLILGTALGDVVPPILDYVDRHYDPDRARTVRIVDLV